MINYERLSILIAKKKYYAVLFVLMFLVVFFCLPLIEIVDYKNYASRSDNNLGNVTTGIVFGAGIDADGSPNYILQTRLDVAGQLFSQGILESVILSGNNDEDYKEVDAMEKYLHEEYEVPLEQMEKDGYGYRTYDTCKRAAEVFEVDGAILITSDYHMPRAVELCNHVGIDSFGFSARSSEAKRINFFKAREYLAWYKAYIDMYLLEPEYSAEEYE